jgi:HTH-type transcriptional regulator/antitoxin HipB
MPTTLLSLLIAVAAVLPGFVTVELTQRQRAVQAGGDAQSVVLRALFYALLIHLAWSWWTWRLAQDLSGPLSACDDPGPPDAGQLEPALTHVVGGLPVLRESRPVSSLSSWSHLRFDPRATTSPRRPPTASAASAELNTTSTRSAGIRRDVTDRSLRLLILVLLPIDLMVVRTSVELGNALRARRRELGLAQEEISGVIGVNRRVIGELERGKGTVQLQIAMEVARVLGLDIELEPRSK